MPRDTKNEFAIDTTVPGVHAVTGPQVVYMAFSDPHRAEKLRIALHQAWFHPDEVAWREESERRGRERAAREAEGREQARAQAVLDREKKIGLFATGSLNGAGHHPKPGDVIVVDYRQEYPFGAKAAWQLVVVTDDGFEVDEINETSRTRATSLAKEQFEHAVYVVPASISKTSPITVPRKGRKPTRQTETQWRIRYSPYRWSRCDKLTAMQYLHDEGRNKAGSLAPNYLSKDRIKPAQFTTEEAAAKWAKQYEGRISHVEVYPVRIPARKATA